MQPSNDEDPGDYRARAEACRVKAERAADHKEEADKWREIAAMWDGLADRFEERSPAVAAAAQPDVIEGEALASPAEPEAPARPEAPKQPPAREADGKPQRSPRRFRRAAVLAACVLPILAVAALWPRADRPAAERKDVEIVAAPSDDAKRRVPAPEGAPPAEVAAPAATPLPESSAAPPPAPVAIAPAEPKPTEPATAASTAPAPEPPTPSAPIATAPAEPKPAGPPTTVTAAAPPPAATSAPAETAPAAVAAEPASPAPSPESPVLGQSETARSDPAQPDVETASAADPKPEPPAAREKFVGTWWPDACPSPAERRTAVPMVLGEDRARAGAASCTFLKKTPGGAGWSIVARCSDGTKTWTANIRLALAGRRLSWASERGTQTYLRCS
ncbi:MAG: hypothetical protein ACJ8DU_05940 [Microvirga sp.]